VIKIKEGMLPLKSSKVWTFIAPLEHLPGAQLNSFILKDMVVESKAKTSLSISILGIGLSA
jgi:hypothetical protein